MSYTVRQKQTKTRKNMDTIWNIIVRAYMQMYRYIVHCICYYVSSDTLKSIFKIKANRYGLPLVGKYVMKYASTSTHLIGLHDET